MSAFVLDASLTLAWHFPDEADPALDALGARALAEGVTVPGHWFAEVANSLWTGERHARSTIDLTSRFLARLRLIEVIVDPVAADLLFDQVLPLARAHALSVYDALYLELAARAGLPLATLDDRLAAAARGSGITVLGRRMDR